MMYNITPLQNGSIGSILTVISTSTNGMFLGMTTIAFYFIFILAFRKFGILESILTSSFLMFILSGLLAYAGYLNFIFVVMYLVIMALVGLYMFMSQS